MAIIEGNGVRFAEHPENLLSNLHQLYTCNMFVDLCIVCHGCEVFAHKAVIAAASPLLRERISEFGDCQARIDLENEVNGVDISSEDIKLLVEYIYKGQVCIPETRLSLFMEVGNHFQVFGLHRQASNFGSQLSFLPQPINNYNMSQHPLPNLGIIPNLGIGNLQCPENLNYEDPNNFQNDFSSHTFPSIFSNNSFISPEKLSDSTIKQDKSLAVPVSNATFSDLCAGNFPAEPYQLLTDRNFPLNIEDHNPKLSCDFQHYANDASCQDATDFDVITSDPFPPESGIQVSSEHSKDIFEDRASSSGASDPETLLSNLSNQPNSFFSTTSLDPSSSSDQTCLTAIPFQPCKIPSNSTLPERQMRLKVKDSIGGVSLQDTSQGEKGTLGKAQTTIDEGVQSTVAEHELDIEEILEEDNLEPFEEPETDDEHTCSHCQKSFPSLEDLQNHLFDQHNVGTMHKCLLCSFKTTVENALVEHGKTHLGSVDRQCCVCGKRFKTRATLRNHLACHASNKWFRCKECSAHYSQRNNLIKHLASEHRLDTEGRPIKEPFACPTCPFVTWASHKLKNHKIRCHTEDKPFKCSHCPYSATERTSLVKHVRTHTHERPFICDSCGHSFVTVSSLKRHCRGHTKEKPFVCEDCGQQYADKKRLKDHYLKHKSVKPFKCHMCEYTCRRKDNLQSHVRRNHGTVAAIEEILIEDPQEKLSLASS